MWMGYLTALILLKEGVVIKPVWFNRNLKCYF